MSALVAPVHTWTLSRNSKLIRFYNWLYDHPTGPLTFCKLFWGIVLSPVVMLVVGIVGSGVGIADYIKAHAPHQNPADKLAKQEARSAIKASKGPNIGLRLVEAVSAFFDRVAAFFQRHTGLSRALTYAWRIPLWSLILGIPSGAAAYGIYNIVGYTNGFLTGLKWAGISLGGLAIIGIAVLAIATLIERTPLGKWIGGGVEWLVIDFIGYGVLFRIGRGFKFIGRFFAAGHHAVKYRTCPLVQLVD